MKRKMISIALAAVAMQAGCANNSGGASSGNQDDSSGPIRIGVIVPLSGPAGPHGKHVLKAITTKAEQINKAGGVDGRKLKIVSKDDRSDPATGVSATTALVNEDVSVVTGGWNSPVTLAIQPVLVRAGILNITTIPQNASILGKADPDAVRMNAGNAAGAYAAAHYLQESLKAKQVSMLLENDAYGNDAGTFLTKQLKSTGIKVGSKQKFDYTDTDFRVPLSKLAREHSEVVFSANAAESFGMPAMAQQYAKAGVEAIHFAALGTVSPKVVELAAGTKIDGLDSADLHFPDAAPFSGYPKNNEFVAAFQKATGAPPDTYAALGAASAALAGAVVAPRSPILTSIGFDQVVITFLVVILAGIGNLAGGLIVGLGLGIFTALFGAYVSPAFSMAAAFAVLLVVLIVRPQGMKSR